MAERNEKGQFVKGFTPWIKGKSHTEATRKRIASHFIGREAWNKDKTLSDSERKAKRNWTKNKRNRVIKRLRVLSLSHTFGEWELLKKQYGYTCPCCKKSEPEIKLTEDHIIPLSKGGTDIIENIQPLCLKCNMHKHTNTRKY